MALRDILVHLDSSARCEARLGIACRLAEQSDARLTGLFAELASAARVGVVAAWPSAEYTAAAEESHRAFATATRGLGGRALWADANRGGEAEVIARATEFARLADIVVLGQTEERGGRVPPDLPERLILDCGRPVLMVPHSGGYGAIGERPMFAWSTGRAAARALADALPLVRPGADAVVIHAGLPDEGTDDTADRVVSHLAAHGIVARFQSVVAEEVKLMDTLLNQAADHSADLLAIGAFENAGFPFVGRGSGTRYILRHMTLPVLFSH